MVMGSSTQAAEPSAPYSNADEGTAIPATVIPSGPGTIRIRRIVAVERSNLHRFSIFLNCLVIVSAVNLAIGQIWGLIIKDVTGGEIVIRMYLVAACALVVLNELDCLTVLRNSPVLRHYHWRGFFYSFFGAIGDFIDDIGKDDYYNERGGEDYYANNGNGYITLRLPSLEHALEWFMEFMARKLFITGVIYFILGTLLVQKRVEKEIKEFNEKTQLAAAAVKNSLEREEANLTATAGVV